MEGQDIIICGCCRDPLTQGDRVGKDLDLNAIVCERCFIDLKWAKARLQHSKTGMSGCTNAHNARIDLMT